jgi:hypothetical protein
MCSEILHEDGSYEMFCMNETPTTFDGVGMDKSGNIRGYWFINEDRTESDGTYVSRVGSSTGKWSYDEGTTLSGTWQDDDGTSEGTWAATEYDPTTFVDSTPAQLDEHCGYNAYINRDVECASGFVCGDAIVNGTDVQVCIHEAPTVFDGVGLDKSGNTVAYWFLNED